MKKTRFDRIKQHIDTFPVLPATVTRLMAVVNDPESSVDDIINTILPDQSLCLTILKIANSALFGRPRKAGSLKTAVIILGFNEVRKIAVTKALINSFGKLPDKQKPFMDRFWSHSFLCGLAAVIIARDLQIDADTAFMAGLIHDAGKLVMLQTFVDDYTLEPWMTTYSSQEVLQEELRAYSFTHDAVGGQLLEKWLFPENLVTAVAYHHRPGQAVVEQGFAYIVQLADILSFYCCSQEPPEEIDIVTTTFDALPDIRDGWRNVGWTLQDEAITGWFHLLAANRHEGHDLKEAFTGLPGVG